MGNRRSGIYLASAAGWQISGNHLYENCDHAIYANDCFATTIGDNYIEDFGHSNCSDAGSGGGGGGDGGGAGAGGAGARAGISAGGDSNGDGGTYYGIRCTVQGGAASIIRNNKVHRFEASQRSKGYRSNATFVYVAADLVNYGVGVISVVGNVIRRVQLFFFFSHSFPSSSFFILFFLRMRFVTLLVLS